MEKVATVLVGQDSEKRPHAAFGVEESRNCRRSLPVVGYSSAARSAEEDTWSMICQDLVALAGSEGDASCGAAAVGGGYAVLQAAEATAERKLAARSTTAAYSELVLMATCARQA